MLILEVAAGVCLGLGLFSILGVIVAPWIVDKMIEETHKEYGRRD